MADDYGEKEEVSITHSNIKKKPKNPVAVSIDDAKKKGDLPTISAAGRGKIAEQILQLAFENDIKVREDSALAEMLANIELDSPIPSEAFMAVAEIMSYVYKANGAENPFDTVLQEEILRAYEDHMPETTENKNTETGSPDNADTDTQKTGHQADTQTEE